jgi:hypothetical protein
MPVNSKLSSFTNIKFLLVLHDRGIKDRDWMYGQRLPKEKVSSLVLA